MRKLVTQFKTILASINCSYKGNLSTKRMLLSSPFFVKLASQIAKRAQYYVLPTSYTFHFIEIGKSSYLERFGECILYGTFVKQ